MESFVPVPCDFYTEKNDYPEVARTTDYNNYPKQKQVINYNQH